MPLYLYSIVENGKQYFKLLMKRGRKLTQYPVRSTLSWAVYDFASTVYAAIVITAYFPLYLTELTGLNVHLGVATAVAMLLSAAVIPVLGAISDHTGRTKAYLIRTTLACILVLMALSWVKTTAALILAFAISTFFFHTCMVFYNSLLPVVAPPHRQGFISGLGVGVGYLAVVLSLPLAHMVDQGLGRPAVFTFAGLFFLIFALPLFIFVPERRVLNPSPFRIGRFGQEWKKVFKTVRELPRERTLFFFLVGNFFVLDAVNCVIAWTLVSARELFHPPQEALIMLLMGVNACAFLSGILNGLLTDRIGAMRTLILSSGVLLVSISFIASSPTFTVYVSVCLLGGAYSVAGIWTSGRKALIQLVREEELGKYFGLYGLTTKMSVISSVIFALVADAFGFRWALWVLIVPALLGWVLLIQSFREGEKGGIKNDNRQKA